MRNKIILIIGCIVCFGIVLLSLFIMKAFTIPESASAYGKYNKLIQVITRPEDTQRYGNYYDLGLAKKDLELLQRMESSYWVYESPNWYIWEISNLRIESNINQKDIKNIEELSPKVELSTDNTKETIVLTKEILVAYDFRDKIYPELKDRILSAAGYDLEIVVKWETLAVKNWSHIIFTSFPKIYFEPLINAFNEVNSDVQKRAVLRNIVQKIIIQNGGKYTNGSHFTLKNGVLTIDHRHYSNIDIGYNERKEYIVELINNAIAAR